MKTFFKKKNILGELRKNTILIGANGSGKTKTLENFAGATQFSTPSGSPKDVVVYSAGLENIKEDVDGKKAKYKKLLTDNLTLAKGVPIGTVLEGVELTTYISNINTAIISEEEVISDSIKIRNTAIPQKPFMIEEEILFNGTSYKINELPSGVRKLIHLHFSIKDATGDKLVLLDEIDSMLHPSWIKLVSEIIIKFFNDADATVIVATHSPELLYLLSEYIGDIAKPGLSYETPQYFNLKHAKETFNDINQAFVPKFTPIKEKEYLSKLKIKMSFQISRLFFTGAEEIILVEGLTDQMYFKLKTSKLVASTFGFFQIGMYLSILKWLKPDYKGVNIIMDGDGNLLTSTSKNYLLKQKLDLLGITNFFFENDLEKDIYGVKCVSKKHRTQEKFGLLEKHIATVIPTTLSKLIDILKS